MGGSLGRRSWIRLPQFCGVCIHEVSLPTPIYSRSLGRQQQEDVAAMAKSTTTTNDYLEDKRADFSKVKIPAYIGASYSTDIHTIGSLRAFEEIPHPNKWYATALYYQRREY